MLSIEESKRPEYAHLLNQVRIHCPDTFSEYKRDFPSDPFDLWFEVSASGVFIICKNLRKYNYLMDLAREALSKGTCEEMVDVLYYISMAKPEVWSE